MGSYSFTAAQLPYSLIMRLRDLILNHKITANILLIISGSRSALVGVVHTE